MIFDFFVVWLKINLALLIELKKLHGVTVALYIYLSLSLSSRKRREKERLSCLLLLFWPLVKMNVTCIVGEV
jgi:hypothetical protein